MSVRIDPHWTYRGLPAVRMENRWLAVEVLPDAGGKILRLIDKVADRNLLWENPRIPPHRAPIFASVDNHWSGGWDESFPCGASSIDRHGEPTPFLGELWTAQWDWRVPASGVHEVVLEGWVEAPITPARYARRLTLRDDGPVLTVDYRIEHIGTMPFDFIWGIHPALAISPAHRLDVPATEAEVDEWGGGAIGERGDRYRWPILRRRDGVEVDMRAIEGPEVLSFALHYLSGLTGGWAACTDTASRRGIGLVFDPHLFRAVWLWLVYGGWRGYHHVAMEPWTAFPTGLADAVAAGRARTMEPGDVLETTVHAALYEGVDAVGGLGADGSVTPAPRG